MSRKELQEFLSRSVIKVAENIADKPGLGDMQHQILEDATAYYDKLIERHGGNEEIRFETAYAYQRLGRMYRMTNAPEATRGVLDKSISILTELQSENPTVVKYRSELAATHRIMGNNLVFEIADEEEGIWHLDRAVSLMEPLVRKAPNDLPLSIRLTYHRSMFGNGIWLGKKNPIVRLGRAK